MQRMKITLKSKESLNSIYKLKNSMMRKRSRLGTQMSSFFFV